MKKNAILFLFLFISQLVAAQNYKTIDEKVKQYPAYKNLNSLSVKVNSDFITDEDKVRAFYIWISTNIEYNFKALGDPRKIDFIFYRTLAEYQTKRRERDLIQIRKIFSEHKALCVGFSLVFKELCSLSNIESNIALGVTKVSSNDISSIRNTKDHAWNVVKINGVWKLIDITWSTGYIHPSSKSWVKSLDDFYFFTKPENFLTSHYPQNSKWQLVDTKIDRKTFFSRPILYPKYFESGLALNPSQSGIINVSENKIKVVLNFKNKGRMNDIYYAFSNDDFIKPLRLKKQDNNTYVAVFYGRKLENKALTLYLDADPIVDFKIQN